MDGTVAGGTGLAETAPRRIDILIRILFDPIVFALVLGGTLALFLLSLEIVTVVYTWIRGQRERRHDRLRGTIREDVFERLVADEPDWTGWVQGLSAAEKRVAKDVLDTYLRQLRGQERTRLQRAGEALDIPEQSVELIREGDRNERLRALVWLSLLEHEIEPELLVDHCREDPTVRAAAARLLYATGSDDAVPVGTELLLGGTIQQMTSFGVDTLYRLHRDDPDRLFEYANDTAQQWSETLTIQALSVVQQCNTISERAPTAWLLSLCDHDSPEVRAATARAFIGFGWREQLREPIPLETLAQDPAPTVRQAVCELLASWNDEDAQERLESIARSDPDPRVRLVAWQELPDTVVTSAASSDPIRAWVASERAIQHQRV